MRDLLQNDVGWGASGIYGFLVLDRELDIYLFAKVVQDDILIIDFDGRIEIISNFFEDCGNPIRWLIYHNYDIIKFYTSEDNLTIDVKTE